MAALTTIAAGVAIAGTAATAYSAYEGSRAQKKAAKAAGQPQQTTSIQTPYMDETIRAMAPYILNEGLNNYSLVNRQLGGNPGNFEGLTNLLQMQSRNYGGNAASPAGIQGGIEWRKKLSDQGVDLRAVFGNNLPEHGGNLNLWGARSSNY